jgi:uncharacterized protein with von Willebrand factor type A (vWA) domain
LKPSADIHRPSPSHLLFETVAFCRALRERGLAVTPSEAIDAGRALTVIDLNDRTETFLGLRSILTSRLEDLATFEQLFEEFWNRIRPAEQSGKIASPRTSSTSPSRQQRLQETRLQGRRSPLLEYSGGDPTAETVNLPGASRSDAIGRKSFDGFTSSELSEIQRIARRIARRLARKKSRRWTPARRGRKINLRRSLRQSLKLGGELIELHRQRRKVKKTRIVVLCDVSGSMDFYSRLLLQFVHSLQNTASRVETFVFSTRLERITAHLKDRSYQQSLDRLASSVEGWSGGTLIGPSVASFNSGWRELVDRRTIIVILSDGWDTGEPEVLSRALADLKKRAARLIWLNPLSGTPGYEPLTRGMQAALPHIDALAPLHNLASIRALERHLVL